MHTIVLEREPNLFAWWAGVKLNWAMVYLSMDIVSNALMLKKKEIYLSSIKNLWPRSQG